MDLRISSFLTIFRQCINVLNYKRVSMAFKKSKFLAVNESEILNKTLTYRAF